MDSIGEAGLITENSLDKRESPGCSVTLIRECAPDLASSDTNLVGAATTTNVTVIESIAVPDTDILGKKKYANNPIRKKSMKSAQAHAMRQRQRRIRAGTAYMRLRQLLPGIEPRANQAKVVDYLAAYLRYLNAVINPSDLEIYHDQYANRLLAGKIGTDGTLYTSDDETCDDDMDTSCGSSKSQVSFSEAASGDNIPEERVQKPSGKRKRSKQCHQEKAKSPEKPSLTPISGLD